MFSRQRRRGDPKLINAEQWMLESKCRIPLQVIALVKNGQVARNRSKTVIRKVTVLENVACKMIPFKQEF